MTYQYKMRIESWIHKEDLENIPRIILRWVDTPFDEETEFQENMDFLADHFGGTPWRWEITKVGPKSKYFRNERPGSFEVVEYFEKGTRQYNELVAINKSITG